jgi:hypothetical protein
MQTSDPVTRFLDVDKQWEDQESALAAAAPIRQRLEAAAKQMFEQTGNVPAIVVLPKKDRMQLVACANALEPPHGSPFDPYGKLTYQLPIGARVQIVTPGIDAVVIPDTEEGHG